jgi:hypothetical protein
MRSTLLRRLSTGAFLTWFAAFGAFRSVLGICPEHTAAHTTVSRAIGERPSSDAQGSLASPAQHHAASPVRAHHAGHGAAAQTSTTAAAGVPVNEPTGHGCDCKGECCCCTTVRIAVGARIAMVPQSVPIATPFFPAVSIRPHHVLRDEYALPFATAPPSPSTA